MMANFVTFSDVTCKLELVKAFNWFSTLGIPSNSQYKHVQITNDNTLLMNNKVNVLQWNCLQSVCKSLRLLEMSF